MSGVFKHGVAVFAKVSHVAADGEIAESQYFGNVDVFWAG